MLMTIKLKPSEEMQLAAKTLLGTKLNIKIETSTPGQSITVPGVKVAKAHFAAMLPL